MGRTPAEKAAILMWEHRCEIDGLLAVQEAFRNHAPGLRGRAVTGAEDVAQIPALAERGRSRVLRFFRLLDQRLAESPWVGGPAYSVADITALVAVDFAGWLKLELPPACAHARAWHADARRGPPMPGTGSPTRAGGPVPWPEYPGRSGRHTGDHQEEYGPRNRSPSAR